MLFVLINTVKNIFPVSQKLSLCYNKIPCVFPVWKKSQIPCAMATLQVSDCPHFGGGGVYSIQLTRGYPIWPIVGEEGVPYLANWGYPHLADRGVLFQLTGGVVPHQDRMGVPPALLGLDGGTPLGLYMGTPLPGDSAAEWVLATQWAVCLLRSCRKTFLLVSTSVCFSGRQCECTISVWRAC